MSSNFFYLHLLLLFTLGSWSCTARQSDHSPHIQKVDEHFQNRRFAQALDLIRSRTIKSQDKDSLLYLMEAGTILHTIREWEKSNLVFEEANELSENIRLSRGKEILSFFINKNEQNFVGENFERVKIKLYIALNYLMLEERGKAMAYFRALNQELSDIRFEGNDYKQNFAARYLGAILAEESEDYNYARIQYNNMLAAEMYTDLAERSLYHLGVIENDQEAKEKYASRQEQLAVYDTNMNRHPYSSEEDFGSLVIIHESGMAPYKVSRGKIKDDELFQTVFKTSLITLLATEGYAGMDITVLLAIVGEAQNPVPVYKERKEKNIVTQLRLMVGRLPFIPDILDDYSRTVFRNYNDRYQDYVNYNIANIAFRVLTVYVTSKVVEAQGNEGNQGFFSFLGLMVNVVGGATIHTLLQPDLRSWNLTYNKLQVKRIFLNPGEYTLEVPSADFNYMSAPPKTITIEPGKATFVLLKSF